MLPKAGVGVLGFYVHNVHKISKEVMIHGSVDGSRAGRNKTQNQRRKAMKLNFLKVLNTSKITPDEIAAEIAALEVKQRDCEQELSGLREQAKDLRKRRLCDEAISEKEIKDADCKVESARLDLEAISDSAAKLNEKLRSAFQAVKDNGLEEIHRRGSAIDSDRAKALEEVARAKARLLVAAEVYIGSWAEHLVKDGRIFEYDPETHDLYQAELERLRAQVKHPTYHEKKLSVDHYASWTRELDVEDEARDIINKHRQKIAGAGSDKQAMAV